VVRAKSYVSKLETSLQAHLIPFYYDFVNMWLKFQLLTLTFTHTHILLLRVTLETWSKVLDVKDEQLLRSSSLMGIHTFLSLFFSIIWHEISM
jgi:hypothetical protein